MLQDIYIFCFTKQTGTGKNFWKTGCLMQKTVANAQVFRCQLHLQVATMPGTPCLHLKLPEQHVHLSHPLMRSAFHPLTALPWSDSTTSVIYVVIHLKDNILPIIENSVIHLFFCELFF